MQSLQDLLALARRKAELDHERLRCLEDELADVLWDYLNAVFAWSAGRESRPGPYSVAERSSTVSASKA